MRTDTLDAQYFPLIETQFPGLLAGLDSPRIQALSIEIDDIDAACEAAIREEEVDPDDAPLTPYTEVLDDVRSHNPGIPLPQGILMLVIQHGDAETPSRMAIPVRVGATS
ncbi:MAG: hypothetical protein ACYC3W_02370 [Candidatus Nanopelagicales bacterium]